MDLDGQATRPAGQSAGGYAMAALLVALAVMSIALTVAMPAWRQMVQREREDELIFRGQQYARAIGLFQRRFGPTFPPNLDVLIEQRLLRRKYTDPVNGGAEFEVLYQGSLATAVPGQGGRGQASPGLSSGLGGSSGTPTAGAGRQSGPGSGTGSGSGGGRPVLGAASGSGPIGQRGGVVGVVSKSTAKSVKLYYGRNYYNEWQFVFLAAGQPGQAGAGVLGGIPGMPRGPGALPPGVRGAGPGEGRGRGGQQGPAGMGPRGGQRGMGPGGMGQGAGTPRTPGVAPPTGRRGGTGG